MTIKVSNKGIYLPKKIVKDVEKIELKRNGITISINLIEHDTALKLGTSPVDTKINDASINSDKYIN
jgi:hypothetical protein